MDLDAYLKSNPHKSHLIFDFDETIFKLLLPWEKALTFVENDLIKLDKSIYEKYISGQISLNKTQNEYISKFGKKVRDLIIQNNIKFETGYFEGVEVNQDLLDFISQNIKYEMYIWSANTRAIIEKILKKYKLLNKFKKIVSRDDVDLLKPDPEGFGKIHDSKISKQSYLFIGDSLNDKLAAKNSGIDLYLIDYFR